MDTSSFGAALYFRPWSWPKWLQCMFANETMPSPSFHTAGIRQRHPLFQDPPFHLRDFAFSSSICWLSLGTGFIGRSIVAQGLHLYRMPQILYGPILLLAIFKQRIFCLGILR